MSYLQKRDKAPAKVNGSQMAVGGSLEGEFEAMAEFVSAGNWSDGTVRVPGTLLICTGEGRWRAWLNDRDGEVAAWVSASSLQLLLEAVEMGLREGSLEWRAVAKRPGKGK